MSIDFSTLQGLTIPEGNVTQIADASGNVLWSAVEKATITIAGNGGAYAHAVIDGVTYNTATTVEVPIGTVISCVTDCYTGYTLTSTISVNYQAVASGVAVTYDYTVVSDATITLSTKIPAPTVPYYYGMIDIVDANAPDLPMVSISFSGSQSGYAYVTIDGTKYTGANNLLVPVGTVITCSAVRSASPYTMGGTIKLNGEVVAERTDAGTTTYEYTVVDSVNISLCSNSMMVGSSTFIQYGTIDITD